MTVYHKVCWTYVFSASVIVSWYQKCIIIADAKTNKEIAVKNCDIVTKG